MDYIQYLEDHRNEMNEFLSNLINIKSVKEPPIRNKEGEIYPFGLGVQKAYELFLDKSEELGFKIENIDNYGGHVEYGNGKEIVGIIGHLDVVPEGENWSLDPYSGVIVDNVMYGRGTLDDKGPMVACLYAMKALKETGWMPDKRVRIILGLDEETDWDGIKYYGTRTEIPDYGFTPDSDFPAINGEKGIVVINIAKKFAKVNDKGLELRSIKGGTAPNMVPDRARALISGGDKAAYALIKEAVKAYREQTGYLVKAKGVGKSLEIVAQGKAAHGAEPEKGLNGISILMEVLGKIQFVNGDVADYVDFYNKHIGFNIHGEAMGCPLEDKKSGKLTVNVGMIDLTNEAVTLTLDCRYPVTCTEADIYKGLEPIATEYNLGLVKGKAREPIYMEEDSPMIKTLMEVYSKHTGDTESKPLVIGGGTYARAVKNVVAFGGLFPGDEDRMHQKDECLDMDKFLLMAKIYGEAIMKISSADFKL